MHFSLIIFAEHEIHLDVEPLIPIKKGAWIGVGETWVKRVGFGMNMKNFKPLFDNHYLGKTMFE